MRNTIIFSSLLLLSSTAQASNPELAQQVKSLWQAQDYATAQALLAPMVNKKTKDAQLLALLGQTEAALHNAARAEQLLETALKYDSRNADYQHWYATVSCNLATSAGMLSALGYAKRCKKAYEAALKLAPENPRSYMALGSFYAQAPGIAGGDKEQARALAQQLLKLEPGQGALLYLKTLQLEDETVFDKALAQYPQLRQEPESFLRRGQALTAAKQYAQAIISFNLALQLPAQDEAQQNSQQTARYQLARAAVIGKTHTADAIAVLQQYIELGPEPMFAEWATLRLAQLHQQAGQTEEATLLVQQLHSSTDKRLQDELKALL
ncbi:tetratricopeptide repeat protein [Rheinheimera gaetbuli]